MVRKLLLLLFASVFVISLGCAKKAAAPPGAAAPAPGPAAVAPAPGVEEEAVPPEAVPGLSEEELAAQRQAAAMDRFINDDIHFDYDRYDIKPEAARILDAKAKYLKANVGVRAMIEGHCDERGTNEYNLALGERRAHAAKKYLVNAGIDPIRLDSVSYGEERPADPGHDENAWAKNRRDHFLVINR